MSVDVMNVLFPPGKTVQILQGNNPDRNLIPTVGHYQIISYSDGGIVVKAITGSALERKFFISNSTPIIMMEAD